MDCSSADKPMCQSVMEACYCTRSGEQSMKDINIGRNISAGRSTVLGFDLQRPDRFANFVVRHVRKRDWRRRNHGILGGI